jgi:hypothetical protein
VNNAGYGDIAPFEQLSAVAQVQPSAQRHRGLTADGLAIRADGSSQASGIGKIGPWPRSADNAERFLAQRRRPTLAHHTSSLRERYA